MCKNKVIALQSSSLTFSIVRFVIHCHKQNEMHGMTTYSSTEYHYYADAIVVAAVVVVLIANENIENAILDRNSIVVNRVMTRCLNVKNVPVNRVVECVNEDAKHCYIYFLPKHAEDINFLQILKSISAHPLYLGFATTNRGEKNIQMSVLLERHFCIHASAGRFKCLLIKNYNVTNP
uniref:Uncharacterized protein n=1 Tax=Glossina pallidipes TaxID=7398 RepID=A0A1B0A0I3_GLOPL